MQNSISYLSKKNERYNYFQAITLRGESMKYEKIGKRLEDELCISRPTTCPTAFEMGEILGTVYENEKITYPNLVVKVEVDKSKVKENIDRLRQEGYLIENNGKYSITKKARELIET